MTRVVIDTNFAGRGHFNQGRLKSLAAKLAGTGAQVVVPEVVIWEWAEHARAAFEALEGEHSSFKVDQALIQIPPLPTRPSTDELCEQIISMLPNEFTIWHHTRDDHQQAVRAQVLQKGAGERKKGVKTGAADHLIFLCIRAQTKSRHWPGSVVAATADSALRRLCEEEFGTDVPCVGDDRQLLARLINFTPAEDGLIQNVKRELVHLINSPTDIGIAFRQFPLGYVTSEEGEEEPTVWEEVRLCLEQANSVEVLDLDVGKTLEQEAYVGSGSVRVFGTVRSRLYTFEQSSEYDFERVLTDQWIAEATIDVPITLIFEQEWMIASVEVVGPAYIDLNSSYNRTAQQ
jgi:hypothetical protein